MAYLPWDKDPTTMQRPPDRRLKASAAEGGQEFVEGDGSEAGGGVGHGVGENEDAVVDEGTAGVDDVGHVAFAFVGGGTEERFFQASDDARGIASVSMGEPQLPSWVNSHGSAGRMMTRDSYQKYGLSENMRWMFSPSWRPSMA